jgi:hypothetical protein
MLPIPNLWLAAGLFAALVAGVIWHEGKVSSVREAAKAEIRAEVEAASARLRAEELQRAAENAAQSEREAEQEEQEDAERERRLEEATKRIEELETTACVISRETVREINRAR